MTEDLRGAVSRADQTEQRSDRGRFARAIESDEAAHHAERKLEVDVIDRDPLAVPLRQSRGNDGNGVVQPSSRGVAELRGAKGLRPTCEFTAVTSITAKINISKRLCLTRPFQQEYVSAN
jgi:hypothetical protein